MDRKNITVLLSAGLLIWAWQVLIYPNLPDSARYTPPEMTKGSPNQELNAPIGSPPSEASTVEGEKILPVKTTALAQPAKATQPPLEVVEANDSVLIETKNFIAKFSNRGGILLNLKLKGYHPEPNSKTPLPLIQDACFKTESETYPLRYTLNSEFPSGSVLSFYCKNKRVKKFTFREDGFFFDYEMLNPLGVESQTLSLSPVPKLKIWDRLFGYVHSQGEDSTLSTLKSMVEAPFPLPVHPENAPLKWLGFRNKYFCFVAEPVESTTSKVNFGYTTVKDGVETISVGPDNHQEKRLPTISISSADNKSTYSIYAGPVKKDLLLSPSLGDKYYPLFDYYGPDFLIHFLLKVLSFFADLSGNMGVAILLLTLAVRLTLFPLNLKAQTSMMMMTKLQPEVKKLQEKYKNDKQALGREQMKLFSENGANPLMGCLPMFIQMPIFISLFSAVGQGFELRQANFVSWITDLSAPDQFMTFNVGTNIPVIGNGDGTVSLNILVFVYVISMFIQQSIMPKNTDPQQQQAQKMMKFVMFGFAFILYSYASGLMLYFCFSNTLGILENWMIKKKILPRIEAKRKARKKLA